MSEWTIIRERMQGREVNGVSCRVWPAGMFGWCWSAGRFGSGTLKTENSAKAAATRYAKTVSNTEQP